MSRCSIPLLPLLFTFAVLGCSLSGTMGLNKDTPARLQRAIKVEDAALPYRTPEGKILTAHYSKKKILFTTYDKPLIPIDTFSIQFSESIWYIAAVLTPANKYILITGRKSNDNLSIYATGIDLTSRKLYQEIPLLTSLSWKKMAESHSLFFRWNPDTTGFVIAAKDENSGDKITYIQGVVFDDNLHIQEEINRYFKWNSSGSIRAKEFILDRKGNLGMIRVEHGSDHHSILYEQLTGKGRKTYEMHIPSLLEENKTHVSQTISSIDTLNRLHVTGFVNTGSTTRAFAVMCASLDHSGEVQKNMTFLTEEMARNAVNVEKLVGFEARSALILDNGCQAVIAEQTHLGGYDVHSPEKKLVYTYTSAEGYSSSYEVVTQRASTTEVRYYVAGPLVLLTVDTTGIVSMTPLVSERLTLVDIPLYKVIGLHLLDGNHVTLTASLHSLGDRNVLVYRSDRGGKDLSYVVFRPELGEYASPQPLVDFSGIGLIWSNHIAVDGDGDIVIPALTSLGGNGSLFSIQLP